MDARVDGQRGFDHGMFIPLKLMFPGADVPVIQLSLRRDLDPGAHLELGRVLAALRDASVLIVGSGLSFKNMRGRSEEHTAALQSLRRITYAVFGLENKQKIHETHTSESQIAE